MPLAVSELEIPGGDIVDVQVAENMVHGLLLGNRDRFAADDHAKLRLVVEVLTTRRNPDGFARPYNRSGELGKNQGLLGDVGALLLRMFPVVPANGDDLSRPGNRGGQSQAGFGQQTSRIPETAQGLIALQRSCANPNFRKNIPVEIEDFQGAAWAGHPRMRRKQVDDLLSVGQEKTGAR